MEDNSIYIFYIIQAEKLSDEIFQKFLLLLPDTFQKDIIAYKHWQSAQASLLGKILLSYGFKQLDLDYTLNDIQIGDKDRPFINQQVDFNISHSGDYIICAIAKAAKVGVDIEKHRKLKMNIAERYFDVTECAEIETAENPEKTFFDLWSIKESAIKCDGRGVGVLSDTHKQYAPNSPNTVICDTIVFSYQQIAIEENYSCCVCSDAFFKIKLTKTDLADLTDIQIN